MHGACVIVEESLEILGEVLQGAWGVSAKSWDHSRSIALGRLLGGSWGLSECHGVIWEAYRKGEKSRWLGTDLKVYDFMKTQKNVVNMNIVFYFISYIYVCIRICFQYV